MALTTSDCGLNDGPDYLGLWINELSNELSMTVVTADGLCEQGRTRGLVGAVSHDVATRILQVIDPPPHRAPCRPANTDSPQHDGPDHLGACMWPLQVNPTLATAADSARHERELTAS